MCFCGTWAATYTALQQYKCGTVSYMFHAMSTPSGEVFSSMFMGQMMVFEMQFVLTEADVKLGLFSLKNRRSIINHNGCGEKDLLKLKYVQLAYNLCAF